MSQTSPKFFVYTIIERKEGTKPFWMRVGTAFENRDGSINIYLDALPVNARLQLREPRQEDESPEAPEAHG